VFAIYNHIEIESIYLLPPEQLEPWFAGVSEAMSGCAGLEMGAGRSEQPQSRRRVVSWRLIGIGM